MIDIRKGQCPLCDHRVILESIPAEFGDSGAEFPAAVTYDARWIMGGRNPNQPHGQLRIYVCRSCGYCQHFADDPGTIPVGREHMTRLITGPSSESPYR